MATNQGAVTPMKCHRTLLVPLLAISLIQLATVFDRTVASEAEAESPIAYISTAFENASPLWWEVEDDGTVKTHLVYGHERSSPNRANGHWLFRVEADPGAAVTVLVGPVGNVYNGRVVPPPKGNRISFISDDGEHWKPIVAELDDEPYYFKLRLHMNGPQLYVARLVPYRISDLEEFKAEIADNPLVAITAIGETLEGRPLEIIRVGKPDAPHRVFIRARAHPWEAGGNWVVDGLVRRLLRDDAAARRCLADYSVAILPMANKDCVARGRTRFNARGIDLNRNWSKPADPALAPENAALEKWLEAEIAAGRKPDLGIDFHNDNGGLLVFGGPKDDPEAIQEYFAKMDRLEALLRQHTWFTEGSSKRTYVEPSSIATGLVARYGIAALTHELNANWIAGLDDYPTAENWQKYGQQLTEVFRLYFAQD